MKKEDRIDNRRSDSGSITNSHIAIYRKEEEMKKEDHIDIIIRGIEKGLSDRRKPDIDELLRKHFGLEKEYA